MFHSRRLEQYAQVIVHFTQRMLDRWQSATQVDIADEMTHLTLAIIANILFDVDLSAEAPRFAEAVQVLSSELEREFVANVVCPDWVPLPGKRRKREALHVVDGLIRGLIRQRKANGHDAGDILSMLLAAVDDESDGGGMSDEQVRDEAMTLFNAGHDTTASALMWTWYLLAMHPKISARARNEIRSVLGDRVATSADVVKLSYVNMVIKEALRLYPPTVALLGRQVTQAVELGTYRLPKGSWVYLMPYATQRDPRFFSDPEVFDPERFAPERSAHIVSYAFFPFGAGPHVCIGQSLAMQEMVLVLATVMREYELILVSPGDEIEPEVRLSIRPKGGLPMRLRPMG
jgi:cytochrome P450